MKVDCGAEIKDITGKTLMDSTEEGPVPMTLGRVLVGVFLSPTDKKDPMYKARCSKLALVALEQDEREWADEDIALARKLCGEVVRFPWVATQCLSLLPEN